MRDRLIDWSASVRAQRLFVSEFVLLELVAVGAEKGSAGEVEDGESDREGCTVAYDSGESFDFFPPPSSAIAHTYQQKEAKVGEGGEGERERERIQRVPIIAPATNPPNAGFHASSTLRKFAAATRTNMYPPPIAAPSPITPPVRVITPSAPTFCFVRAFWMPEMKAPAPAPISVAGTLAFIASRRWKGGIVIVGVVVGGWGSDIFFSNFCFTSCVGGRVVWCLVCFVDGFEVSRLRGVKGQSLDGLVGCADLVSRLT